MNSRTAFATNSDQFFAKKTPDPNLQESIFFSAACCSALSSSSTINLQPNILNFWLICPECLSLFFPHPGFSRIGFVSKFQQRLFDQIFLYCKYVHRSPTIASWPKSSYFERKSTAVISTLILWFMSRQHIWCLPLDNMPSKVDTFNQHNKA